MKHSFIDHYAELGSPLHKISGRTKVIFFFLFLLLVVLTPAKNKYLFIFYAGASSCLALISRLPLGFIFRRILEIIPFALIVLLPVLFKEEGYFLFFIYLLKAVLAITLILLLSATTKFTQLLEALKAMRMPLIFIRLLSFFYRYSFILEDEFLRTKRAYEARCAGKAPRIKKIRIFGNIIGTVFIHTYERAERVYLAMCARGYDGEKSD